MSIHCLLADLASRLTVSSKRHLSCVRVYSSDLTIRVLAILHGHGVIRGFSPKGAFIEVHLKYFTGRPVFRSIHTVSRPGARAY